ncbi:MAG: hypothetical protein IT529_11080 [Burkholderiales bacterium]|nr:hypothetical protein [Burkholderiales bacterium]
MTQGEQDFTIAGGTFRGSHPRALAGATALALALWTGVSAPALAGPGHGKGNGPVIPGLATQALNAGAAGIAPPGLQGVVGVVTVAVSSPAAIAPVLAGPAAPAAPALLPATAPGPGGGSAGMPAVGAGAAQGGALPGTAALSAVGGPAPLPRTGGAAITGWDAAHSGQVALVRTAADSHDASPVFATAGGGMMLAAGRRVELVDPSSPGVRVEVAASRGRAVDLGAILGASGHSGIERGLGAARREQGARNAATLADGRVVLVSARREAAASADVAIAGDVGDATAASVRDKGGAVDLAPHVDAKPQTTREEAAAATSPEVTVETSAERRGNAAQSGPAGARPRSCS